MKEKLFSYAETLVSDESIMFVLAELETIFEEIGLFYESASCVEKMWNISHKPDLLQTAGDIYLFKVRNRRKALEVYNRYMQYSNPIFSKKYFENLEHLGYKEFCLSPNTSSDTQRLIDLCDRFDVITYIIILFHKNKDYQGVMDLKKYLDYSRRKIVNYKDNRKDIDLSSVNASKDNEKYMAKVLSHTIHYNDINQFVIQINPNIVRPYINIIGDYITNKNYGQALDFFNNVYAKKFNVRPNDSVAKICWHISDFYRDKFDFWQAVNYQKISLEIEMGER